MLEQWLDHLSLLLPDVMRILLDVVRPEVDESTVAIMKEHLGELGIK